MEGPQWYRRRLLGIVGEIAAGVRSIEGLPGQIPGSAPGPTAQHPAQQYQLAHMVSVVVGHQQGFPH